MCIGFVYNKGYGNYLNLAVQNFLKGSTQSVTIKPFWTSNTRSEVYYIWIDINRDGDFLDNGELVFNQTKTTNSTIQGNLTIPAFALDGTTRLRVIMKYNTTPTSCESNFSGECEDYTINIVSSLNASRNMKLNSATDDNESLIPFKIYPNPTNLGHVFIETINTQPFIVTVYSIYGRRLIEKTSPREIDISSFPKGNYILELNYQKKRSRFILINQ